MPTFKLVAKITISVDTLVEADTIEQAKEIAEGKPTMEVIGDAYYTADDFWVTEGELDGRPYDIRVAE